MELLWDWFATMFAPAVIGQSDYFGICFTTDSIIENLSLVNFNYLCFSDSECRELTHLFHQTERSMIMKLVKNKVYFLFE